MSHWKPLEDVLPLARDLLPSSIDVVASGQRSCCVIDLDRPLPKARIEQILSDFSPRDPHFEDTIAELRAQGQYLEDLAKAVHFSGP